MPPATERPATPVAPQSAHPPDRLVAPPVVLRRMEPADAGTIAAVVGENLDHLRPWMPWATREAADRRTQLARITEANELWESGTDHIYVILAGDGALVGTIGVHRRTNGDVAEIGYWIAAAHTRRGYAAAAARAVTSAAAALPGVRQVQIQCDEANVASAGIPRKLGYRLDRVEAHEPEAPGERGRRLIWVWDTAGSPAQGGAG